MKPSTLLPVLLSLVASSTAQDPSVSASKASINWSALRATLHPHPHQSRQPRKHLPPPRTLIPELVHAIPASALVQLMVPAQRSSLVSDFKAGSTPAWYASLPSDVKSYVSVVRSQIKEGALTKTSDVQAQKTGDASPSSGEAKAKESEGGAMPAQATGGVWAVGAAGAAGLMGVVLMI
ncbi:hypothetical protein P168DRAFT_307235 [Aspergillus campestris IBT 28561]|uniref:GPI anchored protein n=1 Tax=Aspergillus campestris (strain IBT 28561) TaxID=1392248 RepID=A0A2I1CT40_ASPC2|nr:uncharacterized protein P168DRAFT_307235 [Aspergillus campestris IBT 28561]PKY00788.1 hypothetical protein P168DRAFT_307235 [Aspergillus campestris IBT 28561]